MFLQTIRGTYLREKDVVKSNDIPRGERARLERSTHDRKVLCLQGNHHANYRVSQMLFEGENSRIIDHCCNQLKQASPFLQVRLQLVIFQSATQIVSSTSTFAASEEGTCAIALGASCKTGNEPMITKTINALLIISFSSLSKLVSFVETHLQILFPSLLGQLILLAHRLWILMMVAVAVADDDIPPISIHTISYYLYQILSFFLWNCSYNSLFFSQPTDICILFNYLVQFTSST